MAKKRVKSQSEEIGASAGAQRVLEDLAWGQKAEINRRILEVEGKERAEGTRRTIKMLRRKGFGQWSRS